MAVIIRYLYNMKELPNEKNEYLTDVLCFIFRYIQRLRCR
ncbi:hypothetical protein AB28_1950 [Raoultella ornithinolytica 2-156-04_S1_C2]|nr:hypothetical protein AB28_1950 [Raoultella ornithinolytica 2-156-04_S1_C2]